MCENTVKWPHSRGRLCRKNSAHSSRIRVLTVAFVVFTVICETSAVCVWRNQKWNCEFHLNSNSHGGGDGVVGQNNPSFSHRKLSLSDHVDELSHNSNLSPSPSHHDVVEVEMSHISLGNHNHWQGQGQSSSSRFDTQLEELSPSPSQSQDSRPILPDLLDSQKFQKLLSPIQATYDYEHEHYGQSSKKYAKLTRPTTSSHVEFAKLEKYLTSKVPNAKFSSIMRSSRKHEPHQLKKKPFRIQILDNGDGSSGVGPTAAEELQLQLQSAGSTLLVPMSSTSGDEAKMNHRQSHVISLPPPVPEPYTHTQPNNEPTILAPTSAHAEFVHSANQFVPMPPFPSVEPRPNPVPVPFTYTTGPIYPRSGQGLDQIHSRSFPVHVHSYSNAPPPPNFSPPPNMSYTTYHYQTQQGHLPVNYASPPTAFQAAQNRAHAQADEKVHILNALKTLSRTKPGLIKDVVQNHSGGLAHGVVQFVTRTGKSGSGSRSGSGRKLKSHLNLNLDLQNDHPETPSSSPLSLPIDQVLSLLLSSQKYSSSGKNYFKNSFTQEAESGINNHPNELAQVLYDMGILQKIASGSLTTDQMKLVNKLIDLNHQETVLEDMMTLSSRKKGPVKYIVPRATSSTKTGTGVARSRVVDYGYGQGTGAGTRSRVKYVRDRVQGQERDREMLMESASGQNPVHLNIIIPSGSPNNNQNPVDSPDSSPSGTISISHITTGAGQQYVQHQQQQQQPSQGQSQGQGQGQGQTNYGGYSVGPVQEQQEYNHAYQNNQNSQKQQQSQQWNNDNNGQQPNPQAQAQTPLRNSLTSILDGPIIKSLKDEWWRGVSAVLNHNHFQHGNGNLNSSQGQGQDQGHSQGQGQGHSQGQGQDNRWPPSMHEMSQNHLEAGPAAALKNRRHDLRTSPIMVQLISTIGLLSSFMVLAFVGIQMHKPHQRRKAAFRFGRRPGPGHGSLGNFSLEVKQHQLNFLKNKIFNPAGGDDKNKYNVHIHVNGQDILDPAGSSEGQGQGQGDNESQGSDSDEDNDDNTSGSGSSSTMLNDSSGSSGSGTPIKGQLKVEPTAINLPFNDDFVNYLSVANRLKLVNNPLLLQKGLPESDLAAKNSISSTSTTTTTTISPNVIATTTTARA